MARRFSDVLQEVERRRWPLPAVTIGGDLVPIEWFSAWGLADAVEDWLVLRGHGAPEPSR